MITLAETHASAEEMITCMQKKLEDVVVRNVTAVGFSILVKFKATG